MAFGRWFGLPTPSLRAKRSNPACRAKREAGLLRRCAPRNDEKSGRCLVPKIRFDRAVDLDGKRIAIAVLGRAGCDAHPALADAIFLDVGFLDALEADTDVA